MSWFTKLPFLLEIIKALNQNILTLLIGGNVINSQNFQGFWENILINNDTTDPTVYYVFGNIFRFK